MGPSDNDFVNQFEQRVSNPNFANNGDIILANDQPKKNKKVLIFVLAGVAVLALVVVLIIVMLGGRGGKESAEYKKAAKDYALYFIFGPDYSEDKEANSADDESYFLRSGQDGEFLNSLRSKLSNLEAIATVQSNKETARLQLDLMTARTTIMNCLASDVSNCAIEISEQDVREDARAIYEKTHEYNEQGAISERALRRYENGEINEDEYYEIAGTYNQAKVSLRKGCTDIYQKLAAYAKELYEKY